jgi:thiol-disulfide isomerase/thioredoxin
MKKLILSILAVITIYSCKKKEFIETETDEADNHTSIILTEYKPEQIIDLLNKKNDTLYVTNFFATWCGPCMREIPHFKKKMEELKNQPVKFTFISLDKKGDWETEVKHFAMEKELSDYIILLDEMSLTPDFFTKNFKKWDGGSIPYTIMRKGDKTDETVGMMSETELNEKINSFY